MNYTLIVRSEAEEDISSTYQFKYEMECNYEN